MTDTSLEQPTAETWTRVGLLSSVSVMIGLANQAVVSSLLARLSITGTPSLLMMRARDTPTQYNSRFDHSLLL
jgi:hypothetical protein